MEKPRVLAIVGPTASGKTTLAVQLAQQFNGEVISADSRQVYRGLDEGTAKVKPDEMDDIPHHLIDIVDIDTVYTAHDFARDAAAVISGITSREKLPIIAGGTFFYIDQLRGTATSAPVAPNPSLRAQLETCDTGELVIKLQQKDLRRATEIDPTNRRRLMRALEIVNELGAVPTATQASSPYSMLTLGLEVEKETLRERIRHRAEEWLSGPFENEVRTLLNRGVTRERLQEIGFEYLLMLDYIDGTLTDAAFIQKCVEKNWQYAKRQYTWLRRDPTIQWIAPHEHERAHKLVRQFVS